MLILPKCLGGVFYSYTMASPQGYWHDHYGSSASVSLTPSGQVTITDNNAVVTELDITTTDVDSIDNTSGYDNLTVSTVRVNHLRGRGLYSTGDDTLVEDFETINGNTTIPSAGDQEGIVLEGAARPIVRRARFLGNSTGILCLTSSDSTFQYLQAEEMVGDLPGGQIVQWDKCTGTHLMEDFSCVNSASSAISYPEDNININQTSNVTIQRGLLDGNNAPSGVGVMFEGSEHSRVYYVDCINQGNGSFSIYPGGATVPSSNDTFFENCRTKDNIDGGIGGRADNTSNALIFALWNESTGPNVPADSGFKSCTYYNPAVPSNIGWLQSGMAFYDVTEADFTPRAPITLLMPWE